MSSRSSNLRRPPTNLTIRPPSPSAVLSSGNTPTTAPPMYGGGSISSPRRAPLPPSPTYSNYSSSAGPFAYDERVGRGSFDYPPPPRKDDKRLPLPLPSFGHSSVPGSPNRRGGEKGGWAGAYDNKLVSSTLSHLPPLPPLSPTPTGSSQHPTSHAIPSSTHLQISGSLASGSHSSIPRPSSSSAPSSAGLVVLPDGTALPTEHDRITTEGGGRSVHETLVHSSPSSPWSLLTVHVLPLFAGGPLKTPIEDLNQLCNNHIMGTSQRAQPSRIVAVLTSDLRDFIVSGMLTLKAKFETLEEAKVVSRAAEVWSFFWAQVLPYLEGVFLPFAQVRDLPSASHSTLTSSTSSIPNSTLGIPVRHLLLSGFLLHILLPLLPRLLPLIAGPPTSQSQQTLPTVATFNPPDLDRILQMSLVLSTQAKYSAFFPHRDAADNQRRDHEVRENVEALGKAVRWRMSLTSQRQADVRAGASLGEQWSGSAPQVVASRGNGNGNLQRGPSMSQGGGGGGGGGGRYRRRGWRASSNYTHEWGQPPEPEIGAGITRPGRQNSDFVQIPESRWGRPRGDDEDDDDLTPGQSFYPPSSTTTTTTTAATRIPDGYSYAPTMNSAFTSSTVTSTLTAGTLRGNGNGNGQGEYSVGTGMGNGGEIRNGEGERTPLAQESYGIRRPMRSESSGSSEVTPVAPDLRRQAALTR
ncbi:HbrB-like-domain-containing protein [Naematelia encephala]|uniref:HbrB-like-domain-containing protein n=1 Tax=Naematelia encephala TaxID=71784 RepID=A0A1Y2B4C2_9TREE|nr:HbrB-like-domain-containing protein [Naematelia encephala]